MSNKLYQLSPKNRNSQTRSYLDALKQQDRLLNNKKVQSRQDTELDGSNYMNKQSFNIHNNNVNHGSVEKSQTTNYDRDDSLNDVISFGKQTPFRLDNSNMNSIDIEPRLNLAGSNDFGKY